MQSSGGKGQHERPRVTDGASLSPVERAKLEQRRDRIMKVLKEGDDGTPLDADDREDLMQEWSKIDNLLNRR